MARYGFYGVRVGGIPQHIRNLKLHDSYWMSGLQEHFKDILFICSRWVKRIGYSNPRNEKSSLCSNSRGEWDIRGGLTMNIRFKIRNVSGDPLGQKRPTGSLHYGIEIRSESPSLSLEAVTEWYTFLSDLFNWCADTIGTKTIDWDTSMDVSKAFQPNVHFNFRDPKHRVLFKLALPKWVYLCYHNICGSITVPPASRWIPMLSSGSESQKSYIVWFARGITTKSTLLLQNSKRLFKSKIPIMLFCSSWPGYDCAPQWHLGRWGIGSQSYAQFRV